MAHKDGNDPSTYGDHGQKADDYRWSTTIEYPDALPKSCTVSRYSRCTSPTELYSLMGAHTCSILRFSYASGSGSTVYKMASNESFQACDFTGAEQIQEMDDKLPGGENYVEYPFEQDSIDKIHYFASKIGCEDGQKVAVFIMADYSDTYDACYSMGTETSRIQHCDCDHQLNTYSMAEVCATGFIDGCRSNMADDLSCCPDPKKAKYDRMTGYTDGGNCIAKSNELKYMVDAQATYNKCKESKE